MNSRSVAIFASVVAVIVGAALWFLNSEHAPHYSPKADATPTPKPAPAVAPGTGGISRVSPPPLDTRPPVGANPAVTRPPTPADAQMTEDDLKIDKILRTFEGNTDADHTNTAQLLINAIPTLSPDGQAEAAQHVANLLSDEEFGRVMPLWKNPGTNPDVVDVIGTDLMNRDNKVMLPAMLEALKNQNHPFHDDARSTLEIFLDEDYEDNIPKWEAAMKKFLKEEAEEEAAANAPNPAPPR